MRRSPGIPLLALLLLLCRIPVFAQEDSSLIEEVKPFALTGSVGASLTGYAVEGIERRRAPFSWLLHGTLTPSVYGIELPIDFIVSEQERSFRQPFNQFGISPSYKWATLHLGYRSMNFSRYTLDGITFLGAGVEANPGKLRIGAMYGRLQRGVEEDTTERYNVPAYERMGYAFKLGFGSEESYVDLSFLHAKDDTSSLRAAPVRSDVFPAENSVVGVAARVPITEELTFEADGGASLFTRDLRSAPLEVDSAAIPRFLLAMQSPRSSTTLSFAGRAGLNLALPWFGVRLGYERIEPDYNSLGAYYFATDMENWTIAPSVDLLDHRLRVAGSLGIQRDNLLATKLARTDRLIGSGNVSWNPDDVFGVEAMYTNYSADQSAGLRPVNDSVRARFVTQSASLAPRILLVTPEVNHFITLVGSYQNFNDLSAFSSAQTSNDSKTVSLIYNATLVRSAVSAGASILYGDSRAGDFSTRTLGGTLNGSISLLDNALSLGGTVGYSRSSSRSGVTDFGAGNVFNESLNAAYRLGDEDNVSFTLYATQSGAPSISAPGFNELTATLAYARSFSWAP